MGERNSFKERVKETVINQKYIILFLLRINILFTLVIS